MLKLLSKQDKLLTFLVLLLTILGLVSVYGTTAFPDLNISEELAKQILFLLVGYVVYLILSLISPTILKSDHFVIVVFFLTLLSLVLVLFLGSDNGPKRWFSLGGFNLQPSEFAKISIILITSQIWEKNSGERMLRKLGRMFRVRRLGRGRKTISKSKELKDTDIDLEVDEQSAKKGLWVRAKKRIEHMDLSYIYNLVWNSILVLPILLLILIQPSLGNTIITAGIWLLLLSTLIQRPVTIIAYIFVYLMGINISLGLVDPTTPLSVYTGIDSKLLLILLSLVIVIIVARIIRLKLLTLLLLLLFGFLTIFLARFAWDNVLTGYQQDRVASFLNPSSDPLGSEWQVRQAGIAIASGQIFGKGLLMGTQTNYGLLPYAYTDFAYAAFCEQFGMVGAFIIVAVLTLLISRIFVLGNMTDSTAGKLTCYGVGLLLAINSVINIGMNLGLMPVTGVPLPIISYGGSAILVNMLALGLVQMQIISNEPKVVVERLV